MKKIMLNVFRLLLVFALINIVIKLISRDEVVLSFSYFLDLGFKSIFNVDSYGETILDIMKAINAISLFILLDLESIIYSSNLGEGFKDIIKYHSKSKADYIFKIVKISKFWLLKDIFYWVIAFVITAIFFNRVNYPNMTDIINIITFLAVNYFLSLFIIILSRNALFSISMYVFKHFIFSIFFGYEGLLVLIIIIIISGIVMSKKFIGENL